MGFNGTEEGSYYLIEVDGKFDVKGVVEVRQLISEALEVGHNCIVFDLKECEFMDSTAVGTIGNLCKKIGDDGRVCLLKPSKEIVELLSKLNVQSLVQTYKSMEDLESNQF